MSRFFLTGAVAAVGLIALPLTATAANGADQSQTQPAPAAAPANPNPNPAAQAAPSASSSTFTDAQLQNFAQASVEIDRIKQQTNANGTTPESQTQMRAALQQHQLSAADYNNIVAALQTDSALAQRVAALRAQAGATATQ